MRRRRTSGRRRNKKPRRSGVSRREDWLALLPLGVGRGSAELGVERVVVVGLLSDAEPEELLVAELLPFRIDALEVGALRAHLVVHLVGRLLGRFQHRARERAQ